MSTLLRLLVHDFVDEVIENTTSQEGCSHGVLELQDSERAAFELKWEEKLRAAVLEGLDVRIPSNGGGR